MRTDSCGKTCDLLLHQPTGQIKYTISFLFDFCIVLHWAFMCGCYNNVCGTDSILWAHRTAAVSLSAYTSHTHRVCCIFSDFHNVKQQISRCINLYAIKAHTVCFLASFACTKMVEALVVSVCVCMHACMRTHLCLLIFRLAATNVLWYTYNCIYLFAEPTFATGLTNCNSNMNNFCNSLFCWISTIGIEHQNFIFQLQFRNAWAYEQRIWAFAHICI